MNNNNTSYNNITWVTTTTCVVCFLIFAYVFSFTYSSNNNDFLKFTNLAIKGRFITKLCQNNIF